MKPVLDVLQGKSTNKIPLWFMRQAGRYLPEYLEVRKNKSFEDMVQNPDIASELTLQPIRRFDLDAAIIFSDILVPIYALERGLTIKPAQGPVIEKQIRKEPDLDELELICPKDDFPYLGESISKVKQSLSATKTLIGFSGAPFTVASYLLEGKSTRDALITKAFAYKYPKAYSKLLNFITDMLILQLEAEVKAGAEVLQIFDSWANTLSSSQYKSFALPYTHKIMNAPILKNVPKIHFAQGSGHLFELFQQSGAEGLSIDNSMDLSSAIFRVPETTTIQGNLDPAILFTEPHIVRKETLMILQQAEKKQRYIFNLGRGIDKDTPLENVTTMVTTVKNFTRY